jgi:peptide/nickel transport system substrate-binding protein
MRRLLLDRRVLHIGLRQDPDVLDPTLGSSYVGRIVFSGLCDKLFDIDEKLNIVPQLATGYEWKDQTHLLIRLRPGCCSRTAKSSTPRR